MYVLFSFSFFFFLVSAKATFLIFIEHLTFIFYFISASFQLTETIFHSFGFRYHLTLLDFSFMLIHENLLVSGYVYMTVMY